MPRRTRRDKKRDSSNDNGDSGRSRGGRPPRVEPTPEDLEAMGPNFMDLSRREATVATARRTTAARVKEAIA